VDIVASLFAMLQLAIGIALLFVLPGATWGPLLAPSSGAVAAAGRGIAVSLLTSSIACSLLALAGLLRPPIVAATLALVAALPLAFPSVRAELLRGIRRLRRRSASARRWWWGAAAGIALALALVVVPSRLRVGETLFPFTSTVWYYAGLARSVVEQGGIPTGLPEWGAVRPFQLDYLPVTAHAAAALELLPGDLLLQLEAYRLGVLVAGLATAWLLLRRWVSSWVALLGACLLLATVRLEFRFLSYKPETFGLVLVLLAIWAADRAIVERSRRLAGLALLTATLAFLSHAEAFLLLGPALLGLAAARLLVSPGRRRIGLGVPARGRAVAVASLVLGVFVGAIVLGSAVNFALTGQPRILGYVLGGPPGPSSAPRPDEVPAGWVFTGDPTWDFYIAAVAADQVGTQPPTAFRDPRLLPRSIVAIWPGLDGRDRDLLVVLGGLGGAPVLAWPWLDTRRRRLVATWWTFGLGLFVGAYLLFALSDTYVPRRTGPSRLLPYELMVPVMAVVFGLWATDRVARPGWRALLPGRGAMPVAGLALAVLAVGALAPAPRSELNPDREPGLTPTGYEAYRWIAANLPPQARILANAYTDGSIWAIGRHAGVVDGRAVYLEDRALLAESTALLLGARVVFADPLAPTAAAYLARERVAFLIVAGADASGSDLGGYEPFATDLDALLRSDRYTLVRTFGGGRLLLFEVRASSPSALS